MYRRNLEPCAKKNEFNTKGSLFATPFKTILQPVAGEIAKWLSNIVNIYFANIYERYALFPGHKYSY